MNAVRLIGIVDDIRQRWMPDGSLAVVAVLVLPRSLHGAARRAQPAEQLIPLRAQGKQAQFLLSYAKQRIKVYGLLRRRCYTRNQEVQWGQVEVWVENCHLLLLDNLESSDSSDNTDAQEDARELNPKNTE